MTVINSAVHFDTDEDYTVELLDVLLNGLPVSLSEEPQEAAETIQVPWNFSSLQLKVLLNEGDVFRKNFFRFNIEGLDQELASSNSNSLVINYLPIGSIRLPLLIIPVTEGGVRNNPFCMLWLLRLGGRPAGSIWDYIYCWEQWLIALSTTSIARRKPNRNGRLCV